ncbi:MAG: DUF1801 domain-containing protein [Tabrizicola sp.]|nr:DUF1801 domain-containing protein [Tabrizicola sp.]
MTDEVRAAFAAAPPVSRQGMLALRQLIFDVAGGLPRIGPVEEALRWGEPAYLTPATGAGSTIRLGVPRSGGFALYCNCRTSLIDDFRAFAGASCRTEGNRAVVFRHPQEIDAALISILIRRSLTWHWRSRREDIAVTGR